MKRVKERDKKGIMTLFFVFCMADWIQSTTANACEAMGMRSVEIEGEQGTYCVTTPPCSASSVDNRNAFACPLAGQHDVTGALTLATDSCCAQMNDYTVECVSTTLVTTERPCMTTPTANNSTSMEEAGVYVDSQPPTETPSPSPSIMYPSPSPSPSDWYNASQSPSSIPDNNPTVTPTIRPSVSPSPTPAPAPSDHGSSSHSGSLDVSGIIIWPNAGDNEEETTSDSSSLIMIISDDSDNEAPKPRPVATAAAAPSPGPDFLDTMPPIPSSRDDQTSSNDQETSASASSRPNRATQSDGHNKLASNSAVFIVVGIALAAAVVVGAFILRRSSAPTAQPIAELGSLTPEAASSQYRRHQSPSDIL